MKLKKIFKRVNLKRSKKRAAFEKVLRKLERNKRKIKKELLSVDSQGKVKKLKTKLETNKRHRQKARKLIAELG